MKTALRDRVENVDRGPHGFTCRLYVYRNEPATAERLAAGEVTRAVAVAALESQAHIVGFSSEPDGTGQWVVHFMHADDAAKYPHGSQVLFHYRKEQKIGGGDLVAITPNVPRFAVAAIDDTSTAAFNDVGRKSEVASVLLSAAKHLRERFSEDAFPLVDTNGNRVGQFTWANEEATDIAPEGQVRVQVDMRLIPATFVDHALASVIEQASKRVVDPDFETGAELKLSSGQVVGTIIADDPRMLVQEICCDECVVNESSNPEV